MPNGQMLVVVAPNYLSFTLFFYYIPFPSPALFLPFSFSVDLSFNLNREKEGFFFASVSVLRPECVVYAVVRSRVEKREVFHYTLLFLFRLSTEFMDGIV